MAPFLPEVPEGNLLLLALSPTQILQVFSFGCGEDAGRNVRRKKWSVASVALNTSISQYPDLLGSPVRSDPVFSSGMKMGGKGRSLLL